MGLKTPHKHAALKLALECIEAWDRGCDRDAYWRDIEEATEAIKASLAQPEQEPVAWMHKIDCGPDDRNDFMAYYKRTPGYCIPLYASPPQRQPLTDKDILADETLRYYFGQNGGAGPVSKQGRKVVDAIEAAHGIGDKTCTE